MTNVELQALISNGGPVIDLPAGDVAIDQRLLVSKNCRIRGQGSATRLLLRGDEMCLLADSQLDNRPWNLPMTGHATGLISAGQNTIMVDDPAPYAVGQKVYMKLGVSAADPHECQDRTLMAISGISGGVLTFDSCFPETIPTYSSTDLSWTTYPDRVGPYGTFNTGSGNLICRGYGQDHCVFTFSSVLDDLVFSDLCFGLAPDVGPNPLWMLGTHRCSNIRFERIRIEDFIGNIINANESIGITLDDFTVLHGRPSGASPGVPVYPPIAVNSWGGRDVHIRNGDIRVPNMQLVGTEGAKGVIIENCTVDVMHDPKGSVTVPAVFWSAAGQGTKNRYPGTEIRGLKVRGKMNAGIAPQKEDIGITIKDASFLQCQLGNYVSLLDFEGTLEICGARYHAVKNQFATLTIPMIGPGGRALLQLPAGLYRRAFIRFDKPSSYAKILYPSSNYIYTDPAGHVPTPGAWVELSRFYQVQQAFPNELDTYFSSPKQLQFWGTPGGAPTTCTIDIDYWSPA